MKRSLQIIGILIVTVVVVFIGFIATFILNRYPENIARIFLTSYQDRQIYEKLTYTETNTIDAAISIPFLESLNFVFPQLIEEQEQNVTINYAERSGVVTLSDDSETLIQLDKTSISLSVFEDVEFWNDLGLRNIRITDDDDAFVYELSDESAYLFTRSLLYNFVVERFGKDVSIASFSIDFDETNAPQIQFKLLKENGVLSSFAIDIQNVTVQFTLSGEQIAEVKALADFEQEVVGKMTFNQYELEVHVDEYELNNDFNPVKNAFDAFLKSI